MLLVVYDNVSFNLKGMKMTPRMQAASEGNKFYEGSQCKNCGSTKKATMNATCVICSNKRSALYVNQQRQKIKELIKKANGG
tara:strand:+ start:537 stop:782 length:246 start_codon:yes stop_codon:yes gene_type:complete